MREVVVVATLTAKKGRRADVEAIARELAIPATHAEEGCIAYALHRDLRNRDRVVFIERWVSADALNAHLQMPHLKEFLVAVGPFCTGPADVSVLEACGYGDPVKGRIG